MVTSRRSKSGSPFCLSHCIACCGWSTHSTSWPSFASTNCINVLANRSSSTTRIFTRQILPVSISTEMPPPFPPIHSPCVDCNNCIFQSRLRGSDLIYKKNAPFSTIISFAAVVAKLSELIHSSSDFSPLSGKEDQMLLFLTKENSSCTVVS